MANIKFNVGNDPVTGKKQKYTSVEVKFQYGVPIEFIGSMSLHEVNDDSAVPAGSLANQKRAVESRMENYPGAILGKPLDQQYMDSVTRLYLLGPNDLTDPENPVPYPNAILMSDYFQNKVLSTYPGVGGGKMLWEAIEGLCKEMIAIRQANGELPV